MTSELCSLGFSGTQFETSEDSHYTAKYWYFPSNTRLHLESWGYTGLF